MAPALASEELTRPTRTKLRTQRGSMPSRRDFKRRKRRVVEEEGAKSLAIEGSAIAGARPKQFISMFIFINLSLTAALRLANANEIISTEFPPSDSPEAQPLVYNLLMREFGSGDGGFTGASRSGNQRLDLSSSSSPSSSVSPSLIEARCWNNYENDHDCKQLNVITAPNAEELLRQKQLQQQQSSSQFGVDSIITPVVIFEAASTIEPESEPDERHGLFTGQPPYQTSGRRRPNDQFASPPQTATILPVDPERPVTRPSVKNSVIYVATPQPRGKPGTHIKTTTVGRKCRDEDDADCDEPDDESRDQSTIGSSDGRDDIQPDSGNNRAKDRDSNSISSEAASTTGNSIESGSGGFAPTDDNDDSTDDADDNDDDSNGASNTIDDSSGSLAPQPDDSTRQFLEVTTVDSGAPESTSDGAERSQSSMEPTSTRTESPSSTRQQTGAEIEVVVHSTLPPSFPISTKGTLEPASTSSSTTAAPTTQPPDEVFTSRPIFPPSTEGPANSTLDNPGGETDDGSEMSTTTEIDLYTFKPIPMPVEQSPSRYGARAQKPYSYEQTSTKSASSSGGEEEVSSKNIFRRPLTYETARNSFDDGWTTRRPLNQASQLGARDQPGQLQSADSFAASNRAGAPKGHTGTDMLPTLLLYASIIVLVTTALIFTIMVYVFWRRNTTRRQQLMQKARLLNGAQQPPHAAHMAHSFLHASQLHGGAGPPDGQPQSLLSTYAPGKSMSVGKVTTSIAKPSDRLQQHFEEDDDESAHDTNGGSERAFHKNNSKDQLMEGDDEGSIATGNQLDTSTTSLKARAPRLDNTSGHLNQQSWSTDDPTTSSGTGNNSSRIQENQQAQRQTQHNTHSANAHSRATNYPNSLSDGRQNSSSISDSQCSPDASIEGAPAMQPAGPPPSHNQAGTPQVPHMNARQLMQSPRMVGLAFGQQMLMRPAGGYPNLANGDGSPLFRPTYGQPMVMTPNGFGLPMKGRPIASRSIEDLQLSASSSHVGFFNQPLTQQQVPVGPLRPQMSQPGMVPHLMRANYYVGKLKLRYS